MSTFAEHIARDKKRRFWFRTGTAAAFTVVFLLIVWGFKHDRTISRESCAALVGAAQTSLDSVLALGAQVRGYSCVDVLRP
jgi:hypothetical protein